MGFFHNDRFHLVVSLNYSPEPGEVNFLFDMFQAVSDLMYEATNNQHSIGSIQVNADSLPNNYTDILINDNRQTFATDARLWIPDESLDYARTDLVYPGVMFHELAHYLYDLHDEYKWLNGVRRGCQEDITTRGSIMEWYTWDDLLHYRNMNNERYIDFDNSFLADHINGNTVLSTNYLNRFCEPNANNNRAHNHTTNNEQNRIHGRSSWDCMIDDSLHNNIQYNLNLPGPPPGPPPITPIPNPGDPPIVHP